MVYSFQQKALVLAVAGTLVAMVILLSIYPPNMSGLNEPLHIDGNSEMVVISEHYHWPGNGTASDPFMISGLDIHSGLEYGINISNTDLHFRVTGCSIDQSDKRTLEGSYGDHFFGYAVTFNNVQNGEVSKCTIRSEHCGLKIVGSLNLSILDNSIYGFDYGFLMQDSGYGRIMNNTIGDQYTGMIFQGNHDLSFAGNTCQGKYSCLKVNESTRDEFTCNSFSSTYDTTVEIVGCSDGTFQGNTVHGDGVGMSVSGCSNESLIGNGITGPGALFVGTSNSLNISRNVLYGTMTECLLLGHVSGSIVTNNDIQGRYDVLIATIPTTTAFWETGSTIMCPVTTH
ncbi:MAG: NosD domain-containing protein [Methanomassiliicoccales archaeon]|jgi:parallel beta-helix repeat protein